MVTCLLPLFWLLAHSQSAPPDVDIRAILQLSLNHEDVAFFLKKDTVDKKAFVYYFEELPVVGGQAIQKPRVQLRIANKPVTYSVNMTEISNGIAIIIESITVGADKAAVHFRVPYNSVLGRYELIKKNDKWLIVKHEVEQT